MKFNIKFTVVFVFLGFFNNCFAKDSQVNEIDFFQENFDLTLFEQNAKSDISQLINEINKGDSSASSESDLKSFVDLGFNNLNDSQYFCSTKGCILFLSLSPESSKAAKYGADDYISNIDQNYWYDFKSKDIFQSNENYYLVLLK